LEEEWLLILLLDWNSGTLDGTGWSENVCFLREMHATIPPPPHPMSASSQKRSQERSSSSSSSLEKEG
jgi:hypothetical protein